MPHETGHLIGAPSCHAKTRMRGGEPAGRPWQRADARYEESMKLKLDDQGHAVLQNGMPVYIHDDGKESPFDAAAAAQAIKDRNAEARTNRERAEKAEINKAWAEKLDVESKRAQAAGAAIARRNRRRVVRPLEVHRRQAGSAA